LSLQFNLSSPSPGAQPRHSQEFSGGQSRGDRHAPVNSYDRAIFRCGDRGGLHSEADMPSAGSIECYPARLNVIGNGPGPSEPDPTSLGHSYGAHFAGQPPDLPRLQFYDTKALMSSRLAPGRSPVSSVEEGSHRLREVPQSLLLHHVAASIQPRELSSRDSQLSRLLHISGCWGASRAVMKVLLHSQVPNEPGMRAVLTKDQLLLRCRRQSIPGHTPSLVTPTDNREEVTWRSVVRGEGAGIAPRFL
jgi:hypothetical protein